MKLRQRQCATTVAQTASFSDAASLCNVTQPTLSSAVLQLEQELGAKLFHRTTRKVELTAFGRHMVPYLESVLSARSEVEAAARNFHDPDRQLLRIGISPLADMRLISMVVDPFIRAHPKQESFFKECLLDDLAGRLANDTIDLAILPKDSIPSTLQQRPYYSEPMYYLPVNGVADGHGGAMSLSDIPDQPVIMTGGGCGLNRSLEVVFASEGIAPPAYPGHAISYAVIQDWVWLGLGAAILPRSKLADTGSAAMPLLCHDGRQAQFEFCWCWLGDALDKPHVSAFLKHVDGKGDLLMQGQDMPGVG